MFFRNKIPSHLPFAKGKYVPGALDLMTEYDKNGLFMRLYYPSDLKGDITEYSDKWLPWLPESHYFYGLAKVVMIWPSVLRFIMWLYSGQIHIPAVNGAKPNTNKTLKCIIMSHGLGAARYLYSSLCIDLASRGYLVACVEHRDESSSSTYYYNSLKDVQENKKTFIKYVPIRFGENHLPARNRQVNYRSEECIKIVNLLNGINNGGNIRNVLDDLPNNYGECRLKMFENLLDLSDLSMMGHSFGGATALLTMQRDVRIKQGILLDPWMFPIKDEKMIFENLDQPLLFINTQTFHIATNVKAMEKLLDSEKLDRKMFTILHSTHESQCDSPFAFGYWLNWFMKKLKPINAHTINLYLILDFLNRFTGVPEEMDKIRKYLAEESHNYVEGITKPWL